MWGGAEGIISLNVVDQIKKIYIFEGDRKWKKALMATFAPYKGKVVIIDSLASDIVIENVAVTLDSAIKEKQGENIFIKIDVEGMELEVLQGAKELLNNNYVKIACCTYHRQDDYEVLKKYLKQCGYLTGCSDGFMLFMKGGQSAPYFRKGVLYACNK